MLGGFHLRFWLWRRLILSGCLLRVSVELLWLLVALLVVPGRRRLGGLMSPWNSGLGGHGGHWKSIALAHAITIAVAVGLVDRRHGHDDVAAAALPVERGRVAGACAAHGRVLAARSAGGVVGEEGAAAGRAGQRRRGRVSTPRQARPDAGRNVGRHHPWTAAAAAAAARVIVRGDAEQGKGGRDEAA